MKIIIAIFITQCVCQIVRHKWLEAVIEVIELVVTNLSSVYCWSNFKSQILCKTNLKKTIWLQIAYKITSDGTLGSFRVFMLCSLIRFYLTNVVTVVLGKARKKSIVKQNSSSSCAKFKIRIIQNQFISLPLYQHFLTRNQIYTCLVEL